MAAAVHVWAPVADRGSINEIVFSFVDDRLFRMTVVYDRSRTSGLTNADMIAALTDMYGAATSPTKASADAALGITCPRRVAAGRCGCRPSAQSIQRSVLLGDHLVAAGSDRPKSANDGADARCSRSAGPRSRACQEACGRTAPGRGAGSNREQEGVQAVNSASRTLTALHCAGTGQRRGRRGREAFRRAIDSTTRRFTTASLQRRGRPARVL